MTDETATNLVEDATDHAAASRPEVESHPAHTFDPEPSGQDDDADQEADTGQSDDAVTPAEETDEVEVEGKKYAIPKALKSAFLMQADYTRKTQAVAEAARQVQAAQDQFDEDRKATVAAIQAEITDHAAVHALRTQLDAWKGVDWDRLEAHDRENGTQEMASAMRRHAALKDALAQAETSLTAKQTARAEKEQAEMQRREEASAAEDAKQISEGVRHLVSKIPDWSTAAPQVAAFGQQRFGFTPAELAAVRDPRMFEVLHLAMVGAKALEANKTAAQTAKTQVMQPAAQVGGRAAPTRDMSRMSTDDWIRARNQQVADRRAPKKK